MLTFARAHAKNYIFSQNGEEGVLREILHRIDLGHGTSVEIGGHDGQYCSNTAFLADRGWYVNFVEADPDLWRKSKANWEGYRPNVNSILASVTPENINTYVGPNCDLLSLDTDGSDFQLFRALVAKPKIVIIEIDSSLDPCALAEFNKDGGAGYLPMLLLAINKGYFLICHVGNMIFVDNAYRDLFPDIVGDGISNWTDYFNTSWRPA